MEPALTVERCRSCEVLSDSRTRIVNGVGPPDADLLLVGEAPGEREDARGEPFVGRSGDRLEEALRAAGTSREAVRITNAVRCRPPGNRDPRAGELANCRGHLEREILAVDPAVIVTLGKVPGEHLLGRSVAVTREVGAVESITIDGREFQVLVGLHPAASLYDPSTRSDFEAAIERAVELAGEHSR